MTRFEQLQWVAIYAMVHAAAITVVVEGVKVGMRVIGRPLGGVGKIVLPLILGVSSFFVCPIVIELMQVRALICLGQEHTSRFCSGQMIRASLLWWVLVSPSSMGVFSVFKLVKHDLVEALIRKIRGIK